MPNGDSRDGFLYPTLKLMINSIIKLTHYDEEKRHRLTDGHRTFERKSQNVIVGMDIWACLKWTSERKKKLQVGHRTGTFVNVHPGIYISWMRYKKLKSELKEYLKLSHGRPS